MMMADLDGWQLLRLLPHYPELAKIPIIIVTGLRIATDEWGAIAPCVRLGPQNRLTWEYPSSTITRRFYAGPALPPPDEGFRA